MNYICVIFGTAFIFYGFFLAFCGGYKNLPLWKKMPAEEKRKIRIASLCRNIGEMIMLCGIIFLIKGICADFSEKLFTAAFIAWFIVSGFDVMYISKSKRYIKK